MNQLYSGMPAARLDGVVWRKSHFSNPSGNCVEVAELPDGGSRRATPAIRRGRR